MRGSKPPACLDHKYEEIPPDYVIIKTKNGKSLAIQSQFTPKICSIAELNLLTTTWDDGDGAVLDEVHFPTQRSLSYNKISRLEDFETQLGQDHRHKMRVSVGKQWHIGYESTTVIADNLLHEGEKMYDTRSCHKISLPVFNYSHIYERFGRFKTFVKFSVFSDSNSSA